MASGPWRSTITDSISPAYYHVKDFCRKLIPFLNVPQDNQVCLQCHSHLKTRQMKNFRFCSQKCALNCWQEFEKTLPKNKSSGGIPFCLLPGCEERCHVEINTQGQEPFVRVHEYCGKRHARVDKHSRTNNSHFPGNGNRLGTGGNSRQHSGIQYNTGYSWNPDHIYFYNKDEPYYEFTNFYIGTPIILDDFEWKTTEHYFQAQKFIGTPYVEKIRNSFSPREAFSLARTPAVSRWKRSDWENVKLDVMRKALFAKFTQHDHLRERLLDTGERKIVERSPYDSYWGDGGDGTGENHLGCLLEELRGKLLAQIEDCIETDGVPSDSQTGVREKPSESESQSEGNAVEQSTPAESTSTDKNRPMLTGLSESTLTRPPLHTVHQPPSMPNNDAQGEDLVSTTPNEAAIVPMDTDDAPKDKDDQMDES